MSNEKDTKRKKTMYVPDEDVLAYSRAKKETEAEAKTEVEAEIEAEINEPAAESFAEAVSETVETVDTLEAVNEEMSEEQASTEEKSEDEAVDSKKPNILTRILHSVVPLKSDTKKTIIIKCVSIVAAIALIVSGTYLATYFIDLGQQDSKIENVRNNYELNRDDYSKNEDNQFSKFDILKAQNSDIVGWLTIPNTEVNNPVYQTIDNQFYVDHDMDKKKNSYGALCLDFRCDINPMSLTQNQIIYGHNMRYGAMFGTLKEYRDIEFYKQNPLVYFDSLYEQRVYKIFAIMLVDDTEDSTFGYTYSAYRSTFTGEADFNSWIKYSQDRSLFDIPVDINSQDEIITLSTCCYDYDNARFVILARLVREGEDTAVDTASAVKNSDVIYSKRYYDKKKLPVPKLTSSEETASEEKK